MVNRKLSLYAASAALLSGCSYFGGESEQEHSSAPPPAPVVEDSVKVSSDTEGSITPAEGTHEEKVGEYLERAEEARQRLEKKLNTTEEVSWIQLLFPIAHAQNDAEITNIDDNTSDSNTTNSLNDPTIATDEESIEDLIAEIELNTTLAAEAAEDASEDSSIEVVEELLQDILSSLEESQDVITNAGLETDILDDSNESIAEALDTINEALNNGDDTVMLEIDTVVDYVDKTEDGSIPQHVDWEDIRTRRIAKAEERIAIINTRLNEEGVPQEEIDRIIAVLQENITTLQNAENPKDGRKAWLEGKREHAIVKKAHKVAQKLKEEGLFFDAIHERLAAKKIEMQALRQEEENNRKEQRDALKRKIESGEITKEDVKEVIREQRDAVREERTDRIFTTLQEKNPEKAAAFMEHRASVQTFIDEKRILIDEKRAEVKMMLQEKRDELVEMHSAAKEQMKEIRYDVQEQIEVMRTDAQEQRKEMQDALQEQKGMLPEDATPEQRQEMIDAAEAMRTNLLEQKAEAQNVIQEKKMEVQDALKAKKTEVRDAVQEMKAEVRDAIEEKKTEMQDAIEAKKAEVRDDMQEKNIETNNDAPKPQADTYESSTTHSSTGEVRQ